MIDFEHVYKTYETHNDENVALEDINIHIDEGEFVFILGHSGAGKSSSSRWRRSPPRARSLSMGRI